MTLGLAFMLVALLCFGCLGLTAKAADLRACRPSALYAFVFLWAALFAGGFLWFSGATAEPVPSAVLWIAAPFGISAAVGGLAFQSAIRHGKISTGWLIINLSAVIPALASTWIYREALNVRKSLAVILIFASIYLLWKDRSEDERSCGSD